MQATGVSSRPRVLPLAAPMFVEFILAIGLGVVCTALAARISDAAGAAFALANHVYALLFILFRVVGAGISVVMAQAVGSGQSQQAHAVARATLGAGTWVGLFIATLTYVGGQPLLALMQAPTEVGVLALPLLQVLAASMLLEAWNTCLSSTLRAHLRSREALAVVLLMQALQLLLAWWWMPHLGLVGYAAAVGASRAVGVLLHLVLCHTSLQLRLRGSDLWRVRPSMLREVLRIGLPGALENIVYRLAFMVTVAVAAGLGTPALAAQAYALQISYAAVMAGLATGLAVEIVVGHLVGAGQLQEAHRLVRRSLMVGLLISTVLAAVAAVASPWLMRAFTQDELIVALGVQLLWWTVLLEPGRTFNLVVINALRAAGDARFPVVVAAVSMTVVMAGGSLWLGQHLGWGLVGVWVAYAADEWLRGVLMWRRWVRLQWVPSARAARRRLHGPVPSTPG